MRDGPLKMQSPATMEELFRRLAAGDESARGELFVHMHEELRALAGRRMVRAQCGHTLQPSALINEAYLKISSAAASPKDRSEFLRLAATTMRTILIDYARARQARQRRAEERVALDDCVDRLERTAPDLIELDAALIRLAQQDATSARLIELRFFCDYTNEEAAEAIGLSPRQATRDWTAARAWLRREIRRD